MEYFSQTQEWEILIHDANLLLVVLLFSEVLFSFNHSLVDSRTFNCTNFAIIKIWEAFISKCFTVKNWELYLKYTTLGINRIILKLKAIAIKKVLMLKRTWNFTNSQKSLCILILLFPLIIVYLKKVRRYTRGTWKSKGHEDKSIWTFSKDDSKKVISIFWSVTNFVSVRTVLLQHKK